MFLRIGRGGGESKKGGKESAERGDEGPPPTKKKTKRHSKKPIGKKRRGRGPIRKVKALTKVRGSKSGPGGGGNEGGGVDRKKKVKKPICLALTGTAVVKKWKTRGWKKSVSKIWKGGKKAGQKPKWSGVIKKGGFNGRGAGLSETELGLKKKEGEGVEVPTNGGAKTLSENEG